MSDPAVSDPARPAPPGQARIRADIQGLRAVAVGLVVLDHAHIAGFAGGFVGVDVFFVISGFLITGLLLADAGRSGRVGLGGFYARRALRILPAATLVIVVTSLLSVHLLNFVRARAVLTDSVWAAVFLANVHFAQIGTDYFAAGTATSPLQHFWSLSVEEQFYLLWPALLGLTLFGFAAFRRRRPRERLRRVLRGRAVAVLALVGVVSFVYGLHETAASPTAAYFSTPARAWELAVGGLLSALAPALRRLPARLLAPLSWAGLVAIVAAALVYGEHTAFPGAAALLPVLGAAAVLVGGTRPTARGAVRVLGLRPVRRLGDISYSLYLWHWPLLILAADRVARPLSTLQSLAVVAVAVALSAVTYAAVENPFRAAGRGWARRPRRALVLWPVAVGTVAVLAVLASPADPIGAAAPPPSVADAVTQVRAAVSAGEAKAPVPRAVSPALGAVDGDFRSIGACSGYGKTTNEVCDLGDPGGTKTVAVFGDSHATMWLPALTVIAKQAHWQLLPEVKETCTLQDYLSGVGGLAQCRQWYAFALRTIAAHHPQLIVMSNFRVGPWQPALGQIVDDLRARGGRVLVLGDTPYLPVSPVDCLLRPGASQGSCLWPYTSAAQDAEAGTIARAHGGSFVNVTQWFCQSAQCPSVIDGIIPFTGDRHLTGTYARFLAPDLRPYLALS